MTTSAVSVLICQAPFRISNIRSSVLSIPEKAVKMRPHFSEFGWKLNTHGRRENFYRRLTKVVGGKSIPQGARVQVVMASANHDEALFPNPETFHPSQEHPNRHLAFGYGIHF